MRKRAGSALRSTVFFEYSYSTNLLNFHYICEELTKNPKMDSNQALVSFRDADIINTESTVVYSLNMEVLPSQLVYIVGRVGTGKTSIIRTITAENPLESGEGSVCGFNLRELRRSQIPYLRRKLGIVFQDFQLLMDRSVEDNLSFVLKATGWKDSKAISERINSTLKSVDMQTKAHKMPHQLSGGEQQRVAIARALLNDPELIVADEPTGNLDEDTATGILNLLMRINSESGTAIIMVTHNREICRKWPGRIFEIKEETCTEITTGPEIRQGKEEEKSDEAE